MEESSTPAKNERTNIQAQELKRMLVGQSIHFSGPLPHPDILKKYNEVLPNAAERIISMAEEQAKHRQEMEKITVLNDTLNSRRGQKFAFAIVMTAIVVGTFLIYSGCETSGLATIITPMVAIAGLFIYQKYQKIIKK